MQALTVGAGTEPAAALARAGVERPHSVFVRAISLSQTTGTVSFPASSPACPCAHRRPRWIAIDSVSARDCGAHRRWKNGTAPAGRSRSPQRRRGHSGPGSLIQGRTARRCGCRTARAWQALVSPRPGRARVSLSDRSRSMPLDAMADPPRTQRINII